MAHMNRLLKERSLLRRNLVGYCEKRIDDILKSTLEDKANRLFQCDAELYDLFPMDLVEREFDESEQYRELFHRTLKSVETFENQVRVRKPSHGADRENKGHNIKLPHIEWSKFDGNIQNWIAFWAQFEGKVHKNEDITDEDKFQYLLQATTGKAKVLVGSYTPLAGNYVKALDALKGRFAREDMLTDFYVRQLIGIVINQVKKENSLSVFYDDLRANINNLETLGLTSKNYQTMLVPLIEFSLPNETLKEWERQKTKDFRNFSTLTDGDSKIWASASLTDLLSFIETEVAAEEKVNFARGDLLQATETAETASALVNKDKGNDVDTRQRILCVFCDLKHSSMDCWKAKNLSLTEKRDILSKKRACFLCFNLRHRAVDCEARVKCAFCSRRHDILMCPEVDRLKKGENRPSSPNNSNVDRPKKGENRPSSPNNSNSTDSKALMSNHRENSVKSRVYLQTLIVEIILPSGKREKVRCIIDSGSSFSYIRKDLAERLNIAVIGDKDLIHCLFGGVQTEKIKHTKYNIVLKGINREEKYHFNVLEQTEICHSVGKIQEDAVMRMIKEANIHVTDCGSGDTRIDILIGSDALGKIYNNESKVLADGLVAINTNLGWTIMGQAVETKKMSCSFLNCAIVDGIWEEETLCDDQKEHVTTSLLTNTIEDYWSLEVLGIVDNEDNTLLEQFKGIITTNAEGRYEIKLPWSVESTNLGDNFFLARKRLMALTQKLKANGRYDDYVKVFKQWEHDGIVEKVNNENVSGHYLVHHPVYKESSVTTKVRPVFNASAKTKTGRSLNDCLHKGPNLVALIPHVLLNFRTRPIGIVADVKQAFLQISMNERDREFLKFLIHDEEGNVITYRNTRLPFGLSPSPFLLAATINYHLGTVGDSEKETALKLLKSLYIDDCVISVDDEHEAEIFATEANELMKRGKFELRRWQSSLNRDLQKGSMDLNSQEGASNGVLGLIWNSQEDTLVCDTSKFRIAEPPFTKRTLLALAMMIFDPIGVTVPVTILPKVILQSLWKQKLEWDTPLPETNQKQVQNWVKELHCLSKCTIPRYMLQIGWKQENSSIHVFVDGSKLAYAACIFVRSCVGDEIRVQLVMAKARIAPIKDTSIPRIELLAAQVGSRLYNTVCESEILRSLPCYFWTDSTVVLCWLNENVTWKSFVSNRVSDILKYSKVENWRHVPGILNPCDLLTRGCGPSQLEKDKWWEGPDWLRKDKRFWPSGGVQNIEPEAYNESLSQANVNTNLDSGIDPAIHSAFKKYDTFTRVLRCVAWWIKFFRYKFKKASVTKGISAGDLAVAETRIFLIMQKESFPEGKLPPNLRVTIDENGVRRVVSRLILSEADMGIKYPVLVHNKHALTHKIIWEKHIEHKHASVLTLMVLLRKDFWVIKCRKTVKEILRQCMICKRFRAKPLRVPEAPLPVDRIEANYPFETTGIDLAGPLFTLDLGKVWIVIFTCAVFRCVHLELVSALSKESFLMAMRRFISRRGRMKTIYTDNGTNFHGANNGLNNLDWDEIVKESDLSKIIWKFNAPTAAWWGGFWERLLRVVKDLLRKNLGRAKVTYEQLETLVVECENIVNNRPLTYMCEEEQIIPLTPSLILNIQCSMKDDIDQLDRSSFVEVVKNMQVIRDELRRRFREEYVNSLISRKPCEKADKLRVGEIVLVECDQKKRLHWPLGRILEIYTGKDKHDRAAKIKVAGGEITRPFQRIYPLEVTSSEGTNHIKQKDLLNHKEANNEEHNVTDKEVDDSYEYSREDTGRDQERHGTERIRSPDEDDERKTRTRVIRLPSRYRE